MPKTTQTSVLSKLKVIYFLLSNSERKHLLLIFCLMLITTMIEVVGVGSIFPLLQILSTPEKFAQGPVATFLNSMGFSSTKEKTIFLIATFAIFLLLSNMLSVAVFSQSQRFAWTNWRNFSIGALRHYLQQPYEFFLGRNSSDLTKIVTHDSNYLGVGVLLPLLQVLARVLVFAALVLTLFVFEPVITLLLLTYIVSAYATFYFYSQKAIRKYASICQEGRIRSTRVATEAFGGIKDVKILGKEDYFVRQFACDVDAIPNAEASIQVIGGAPRYYLEAITIVFVLSGLGLGIYNDIDLAALIPSAGLFVVACYRMLPLFSQAYNHLTTLDARLITVDNMLADLREYRVNPATVAPMSKTPTAPSGSADISLVGITYSYPNASDPALRGLSLKLTSGETIGIIGMSGSGKSTLIDILLTLLKPQSGRIQIGEMLIEKSNAYVLRTLIGYVPQYIFLSDETILKNIAFGVDEKEIDIEAVVQAAKQSNIHEFVSSLELGYQTIIGERGVRLSGGQRQRLGIARALYSNPPVIVFDEATSALDNDTEAAVMDAINHLDNKTIIIAAHRFSTISKCDAVYEMKNGQLIYLGGGDAIAGRY